MATELKVFIAGSLALEPVRDAVRSSLLNVNHKYDRYGYSIKSYTFENFENSLCNDGRQKDYNDFIRNHADFVIFILDGILGEKTLETSMSVCISTEWGLISWNFILCTFLKEKMTTNNV